MARTIVTVILVSISLVDVMVAESQPASPPLLAVLTPHIVLLAIVLLFFSPRVLEFPSRSGYAMLALMAVLVLAPLPAFGPGWIGSAGFLAGAVLLALGRSAAWWAFGAVVIAIGLAQFSFDPKPLEIAYSCISTAITGLVVYALSRMASLIVQLHSARDEIARMAVLGERLRIAKDLHDLLGYSLSAITLRCELARLLVDADSAAQAQLSEVLVLSRQALSDVRSVSRGYRSMSVRTEAESVVSVLTAAGLSVDFQIADTPLSDEVGTVLSTVLRESATNLLRHSRATWCRVSMKDEGHQVELSVCNDGASESVRKGDVGGLGNLRERLEQLGGSLTANRTSSTSEFLVRARVPALATRDPENQIQPASLASRTASR